MRSGNLVYSFPIYSFSPYEEPSVNYDAVLQIAISVAREAGVVESALRASVIQSGNGGKRSQDPLHLHRQLLP